jgi:phage terminase large subunit-like protein
MSTDTINFEMQKTLRAIPGYDPFATAGDCWFDDEAAQTEIDFIEECCSRPGTDGRPTPFLLEQWQQAIIANLYGWKRPDGTTRYRECFVFVPRKNGKTSLAATIICGALFLREHLALQCYSAAADRDQARIVFGDVKRMIQDEPEMDERSTIYQNSVVVGNGSYKALSAEAGTKHGLRPDLVINDELHAHKSAELTDVLMTGTAIKGKQPLVIHLTTSDYEREGSICNDKHAYASKVRDGIIDDPAFLPVIYEATTEDDWTDPAVWEAANPNYGVSVSEDYLARECKRAQDSPAYENTFKRLHLNIRTEQDVRWLSMDAWDRCPATLDKSDLAGRPCWCGLDLSSRLDLTCFAMVFQEGDAWRTIITTWVPQDGATKRQKNDRVPYLQWIREGWINATPGPSVDYDVVRRDINALAEIYDIKEIAVDPWGAPQLIQQLEGDGLTVFEHRQGFISMSAPTKDTEAAIIDGTLDTGGNPVLRWAASNVVVDIDAAGNIKPTKKKSGEKIDPIVALVMGFGRASLHARQPERVSYYETHGVGMR